MKVTLSTIGKFHTFDLARELHKRGYLESIYTGYPRMKLQNEDLPQNLIKTYPWLHAPYMLFRQRQMLGNTIIKNWEYWSRVSLAKHVAKNIEDCDVHVALSSSGLESGLVVKNRGGKYICDRGSTHIREQDNILREEHDLWNLKYSPIDPRIIEREEAEYAAADLITVPSKFNFDSFLKQGVPAEKLRKVSYGVNLSKFSKTADPSVDSFDIIFVGIVSLRKGVPYLLQAFKKLVHKNKTLKLIGAYDAETVAWLRKEKILTDDVQLLGPVPQYELKNLMSKAHVMVLPSVEEGLAMVQAQAMACGCPVIATTNTGSNDLYDDGVEGYIVSPRDIYALTNRLQRLADDENLRMEMSHAALRRVNKIGGWRAYGENITENYEKLMFI